MMNLLMCIVMGTIIYGVTLNLEAQSTGKGSASYLKYKKVAGSGVLMAWIGLLMVGLLI